MVLKHLRTDKKICILIKLCFQIDTQKKLLPFYFLVTVLVLISSNFFFFWDKDILHARHAFWYLENGFSILQPPQFDSGHPPAMGLLLAFLWKIFGIHLAVGHLAMIPFAITLIWQLYRFTAFFIKSLFVYWALLLIAIDTSILTQLMILTGDLLTLVFFFWAVNSILYNKRIALLFAMVLLALTSSRGMISCMIVGIFDIYLQTCGKENVYKKIVSVIPWYLPSFFLSAFYLAYHYAKTGWIGYNPEGSSWEGLFELADLKGVVRNFLIIGWRLIDFGRLFLWLTGFYFFFLMVKKRIKPDDNIRILLALCIISFIIYVPPMIIYKGLLSHRYILPLFAVFATLIAYLLFEKLPDNRLRKSIYFVLIIGLLSGNFWIYPDRIAKGWDATLAHIPYYKLRRDMIQYIEEERIPFEEICSEIPNTAKLKHIDLIEDERSFMNRNLQACDYIFYSNIYNMFTDDFLYELKNHWEVVREYRLLQVRVTLYKNPYSD